jgi:hypothetical protein
MNSEIKQYCQFCSMCETYYIDVMDETCRCPVPKTESELKEELLSKWQVGDVTL